MIVRNRFIVCFGCVVVAVLCTALANSAPPNNEIIGWKEWKEKNGAPLSVIEFTRRNTGASVAIRGFPAFAGMRESAPGEPVHFFMGPNVAYGRESAFEQGTSLGFEAARGQVIPIYGELYKVEHATSERILLVNVTEKCPKDCHVNNFSR